MTAPIHHIDTELIAYMCKAIGHPVRVQIIDYLKTVEDCTCGNIVDQLPLAQSTVSQHLKVLKDAGIVKGTIDGPRVCYSLNERALSRFKRMVSLI